VTADNAPAQTTIRVLLQPTAVADATNTLEDASLVVGAPGLLGNDIEPNGFALSVVANTQPTHGTATVGAAGTYTYAPAANYYGPDSFTYTITNGNGRAVTGAVNVAIAPVNDAPTLGPLSAITIQQAAGEQTVNLSGIAPGPTNEAGQIVTVSASSTVPGLIPNPSVLYTNPGTAAVLKFTPTPTSYGVATIQVVVSDDGGLANGGVNSVTNSFTVTVNPLVTIWAPGDNLPENIVDANGAPGTGYDQLNSYGSLDVQATTSNRFTIRLASLSGNVPGPAANFDRDLSNSWTIATFSNGITGFDPQKLQVDTSSFTNDLGGGTFNLSLSGDGKSVVLSFQPNHSPVAGAASYGRAWGTFLRISIPALIANATSDVDGDGRSLLSVGASTNASGIATNSAFILFSPTQNNPESFRYTIRDTRTYRPGDTVRTATNWITVLVTNAVGSIQAISASNNTITARFAGVPGYSYDVERTTNTLNGVWIVIATTNAPPGGVWQFTDPSPPAPMGFYRARQH
jgi:hypothetical protein